MPNCNKRNAHARANSTPGSTMQGLGTSSGRMADNSGRMARLRGLSKECSKESGKFSILVEGMFDIGVRVQPRTQNLSRNRRRSLKFSFGKLSGSFRAPRIFSFYGKILGVSLPNCYLHFRFCTGPDGTVVLSVCYEKGVIMDNVVTSEKVQALRRLVKEAVYEATERPTRHKNHLGGEFDGLGSQTYHIDALCEVLRTTDAILVLGHLLSEVEE